MSVDLVVSLNDQLRLESSITSTLDLYYTGTQPLSFLHPQVAAATSGRLVNLVVNWPRVIVGAVEERLDVEGFRIAGEEDPISELWEMWQANELDEFSQLGHVDALVHGRSFVLVWPSEDDPRTPRITVETAREMTVAYVPGTSRIASALKRWDDGDTRYAALYLPDRVEMYASAGAGYAAAAASWRLQSTVAHDFGQVPVVPFINRPRLGLPGGESELADVLPLADAVNKLATDMMVSAEYHAMPRRWATGVEIPGPGAEERVREQAKQNWSQADAGRFLLAGQGVSFGQFSEANLQNFVQGISMLTSQIAAIAGLPPHYLGVNSDNPASADAIRSAESSLVKKARRKMRGFGGSWERVMRLAQLVRDGVADPSLVSLETIWRDPETPTVAQKADAAVKLVQAQVITPDQALEDLGYTPVQIEREQARRDRAALGPVSAQLDEAERLQREQGLSQPAAFAAVGLLQAATAMRDTTA